MKFPGKRLIVEYKNRRVRKDAKSLWGDINLQEISKAIEDEAAPPPSSQPVRKSRNIATHKQPRPILSTPATNGSPAPLVDNAATGRILPALNDATPVFYGDSHQPAAVPVSETETPPVVKQEAPYATPSSKQIIQSVQKPEKPVSRADIETDTAKQTEKILPPTATVSSPPSVEKGLVEPRLDPASDKPSTAEIVEKKVPSVSTNKALTREVTARKPKKADSVKSSVSGSRNSAIAPTTGFYSLPEGFSDDLEALDRENAALKHRLAETLRKENSQLERMLVRASSPIGE
jgi:hypothetical protein